MADIQPHHDDPEYWRARAISALRLFGGPGLARAEAHRILPWWSGYGELSPGDVEAVLAAFPNPAEPVADR